MSTVAKKVIMGSGAGDSAYEIDQSLIFNAPSVAYLHRTPGSASNRKTWTWSAWFKRGLLTTAVDQTLFSAYDNSSGNNATWFQIRLARSSYSLPDSLLVNGWNANWRVTSRVFRDPAAWYHIVVVVDTTEGSADDRIKIYINGVQETSFNSTSATDLGQNVDLGVNAAQQHRLGSINYSSGSRDFDGYLAEVNFIDGTAKAPSDFGETSSSTGQWIPKEYSGSYGTNGFYLKFVSGAIGTDSSGEGNNYTAVNLANADVVTDSPTNNFATLNPLDTVATNGTISEGNLKVVGGVYQTQIFPSTISASSGKWYAEFTQTLNNYPMVGVSDADLFFSLHASGGIRGSGAITWDLGSTNGRYYINSTSETDNAGKGSDGSVIQVAIDADSRKVWFGIDNTWQGSGNPAAGSNQIGVVAQTGPLIFFMRPESYQSTICTQTANFGQKTFAYTPPTGFKALCTANLPEPATPLPSAHFNTVLHEGTGATQTVTGVGFQPDWVWVKNRSAVASHMVVDAVRGVGAGGTNTHPLFTNTTEAEEDQGSGTNKISALNSDGFVIDGNSGILNTDDQNYVSWNWKANGSGSTNNDGNQASVVSANQTAGFSIATFTGTGSYATYGHGLGVIPEVTLTKSRSATGDWYFVTTVIDGSVDYLVLNTTAAKANGSATASTSSVFYSNYPNNETVVAYNFASIPGYSKIGTYMGNGGADGPFVNLGFKPALIMIKRHNATSSWAASDNKRSPTNAVTTALWWDSNSIEYTNLGNMFDLTSNGFKLRDNHVYRNSGGDLYLYMAFAEAPFKYATAR